MLVAANSHPGDVGGVLSGDLATHPIVSCFASGFKTRLIGFVMVGMGGTRQFGLIVAIKLESTVGGFVVLVCTTITT